MIEKLMEQSDGRLFVPFAIVAFASLAAKAIFGLQRSRSADRKDFLELLKRQGDHDDFYLCIAVRHLFGTYLPAALIRELMRAAQPGRALCEIANAWDLVDQDDLTGEIVWRKKRHRSARYRRGVTRLFSMAYLAIASASLWLAYLILSDVLTGTPAVVGWIYVCLGLIFAFWCLCRSDLTKSGSAAIERWIGLT
jgi:hypothetical protein